MRAFDVSRSLFVLHNLQGAMLQKAILMQMMLKYSVKIFDATSEFPPEQISKYFHKTNWVIAGLFFLYFHLFNTVLIR